MRHVLPAIGFACALSCLGMLPGSRADASPIVYNFTGGQATLSATTTFGSIGAGTIPLTGTQVTFDTAVPALTSFTFTAGPTAALPLSGILSGVFVTLQSVSIVPGTGYTGPATGPFAPPSTYNYAAGPVVVSGSASLSGLVVTPPAPFSAVNPTLVGQLRLNGSGSLSLNGITLGTLSVPAIGAFPGGTVTLKADVLFTGMVPEPGTLTLLATGLAGMAWRTRARNRNSPTRAEV